MVAAHPVDPCSTQPITFPGEIADRIIDHLFSDVPSLKTGTLVCRAWLPSCRYHLFRAIICYPAAVGKTHLDFLRFAADAQDVIEYVLELYCT
ncbi:hypothetical protein C8Q76DRAFT_634410 [Earliella scabrosa]|nr:hypothetical protein C8Q76DRAFT_634410 [Earliella scabrosa]